MVKKSSMERRLDVLERGLHELRVEWVECRNQMDECLRLWERRRRRCRGRSRRPCHQKKSEPPDEVEEKKSEEVEEKMEKNQGTLNGIAALEEVKWDKCVEEPKWDSGEDEPKWDSSDEEPSPEEEWQKRHIDEWSEEIHYDLVGMNEAQEAMNVAKSETEKTNENEDSENGNGDTRGRSFVRKRDIDEKIQPASYYGTTMAETRRFRNLSEQFLCLTREECDLDVEKVKSRPERTLGEADLESSDEEPPPGEPPPAEVSPTSLLSSELELTIMAMGCGREWKEKEIRVGWSLREVDRVINSLGQAQTLFNTSAQLTNNEGVLLENKEIDKEGGVVVSGLAEKYFKTHFGKTHSNIFEEAEPNITYPLYGSRIKCSDRVELLNKSWIPCLNNPLPCKARSNGKPLTQKAVATGQLLKEVVTHVVLYKVWRLKVNNITIISELSHVRGVYHERKIINCTPYYNSDTWVFENPNQSSKKRNNTEWTAATSSQNLVIKLTHKYPDLSIIVVEVDGAYGFGSSGDTKFDLDVLTAVTKSAQTVNINFAQNLVSKSPQSIVGKLLQEESETLVVPQIVLHVDPERDDGMVIMDDIICIIYTQSKFGDHDSPFVGHISRVVKMIKLLVGVGRSCCSGLMQLKSISIMESLFVYKWDPGGLKPDGGIQEGGSTSACPGNQTLQHQHAMHVAPMYITETASSSVSGLHFFLEEFFIVIGILARYGLGSFLVDTAAEFTVDKEMVIVSKSHVRRGSILVPRRTFDFAIISAVPIEDIRPLGWTSLLFIAVKIEHIQWEPGGNYYSSTICLALSLCFVLWDPGGRLLLMLEYHCPIQQMKVLELRQVMHEDVEVLTKGKQHPTCEPMESLWKFLKSHLEDKVNFEGGNIDENLGMSNSGETNRFGKVYSRKGRKVNVTKEWREYCNQLDELAERDCRGPHA